ncbi:MAG: hypothetical protein L6R00_14215 [Phycisphaerae bacterium]|nr:hypothetical protein [Phycisphaerae bacterium]
MAGSCARQSRTLHPYTRIALEPPQLRSKTRTACDIPDGLCRFAWNTESMPMW